MKGKVANMFTMMIKWGKIYILKKIAVNYNSFEKMYPVKGI